MSVFNYIPDFGAAKTQRPRVNNINFGDGYQQRVAFGINTLAQEWNLSFTNRDLSEATAIDDFLTARNGVEAFSWTPPGGTSPIQVVCQNWSVASVKYNLYTVQAQFRQVFDA